MPHGHPPLSMAPVIARPRHIFHRLPQIVSAPAAGFARRAGAPCHGEARGPRPDFRGDRRVTAPEHGAPSAHIFRRCAAGASLPAPAPPLGYLPKGGMTIPRTQASLYSDPTVQPGTAMTVKGGRPSQGGLSLYGTRSGPTQSSCRAKRGSKLLRAALKRVLGSGHPFRRLSRQNTLSSR